MPPTKFTPAQIKPQSFESRRNSFPLPGVDASHVYVRALAPGCFHSHISTQTFRRALTASVDSCAEIKSIPLKWRNQIWQSLEEGAGKRCSECARDYDCFWPCYAWKVGSCCYFCSFFAVVASLCLNPAVSLSF